jgi:hypothetical protein
MGSTRGPHTWAAAQNHAHGQQRGARHMRSSRELVAIVPSAKTSVVTFLQRHSCPPTARSLTPKIYSRLTIASALWSSPNQKVEHPGEFLCHNEPHKHSVQI